MLRQTVATIMPTDAPAAQTAVPPSETSIQIKPASAPIKNVSNGSNRGFDHNRPPQPSARLGRDPKGNPAWYIPDLDNPGKYLQLDSIS